MVQILVTLKLTSQILLALHKEIIVNAVVTNLRKHCKIPLVTNPCGVYDVLILHACTTCNEKLSYHQLQMWLGFGFERESKLKVQIITG